MGKVGKAREFWVDPESMDDDVGIYDTFDKHPGQGPLQWQESLIQVIEKSAFDKALAGLKRISKTRTRDLLAIEYRKIARETLKELGELG